MLELTSVVCEQHAVTVLNRVSLNLRRGEVLGVVGRNGSGKSALLELMAGLRAIKRGRLVLRGDDQTRDQAQLRQSVVHLGHEVEFAADLSLRAWLDYREFTTGVDLKTMRPRLNEFDEWLPNPETKVNRLSWGQRRRLELAFAFCRRAPIYCFDQVTDGLDGLTQRQLGAQIKSRAQEGTTFVLADHSAEFVAMLCDRLVVMKNGEVDKFISRNDATFRDELARAQGWHDS